MHTLINGCKMAFHQLTSVKNMYRQYFTIEMQRNIFLNKLLVPYAFTGRNLGVGKFDVSVSIMIIFCVNISSISC